MRPYPMLDTINSPHDIKRLLPEQLPESGAEEMREAICEQVSKSGGHLAPNLGVVELTLALHYVFDFGFDRLLFDVGHQCYPHKLITGRFPQLESLRTTGGIAGFPEPRESAYDLFAVGHAGTGDLHRHRHGPRATSSAARPTARWWPWSATRPSSTACPWKA